MTRIVSPSRNAMDGIVSNSSAPASAATTSSHSPSTTTSAPNFARRRLRRRGPVRSDCGGAPASCAQGDEELAGYAQFRRRAAPEQIGRSRGHHGHVRLESRDSIRKRVGVHDEQRSVEYFDRVSGALQQHPTGAKLQRQMRLAATEVYAAIVAPARIDERDFHSAASARVSPAGALSAACNHAAKRITPSRQAIGAASASSSRARDVSET